MSAIYKISFCILFAFAVTACCHNKKQTKTLPAKEALPDRNTRDPKLKDSVPKIEIQKEN